MGDLKEAPNVQYNFLSLVFCLYITFKSGNAAPMDPIPLLGRLGE